MSFLDDDGTLAYMASPPTYHEIDDEPVIEGFSQVRYASTAAMIGAIERDFEESPFSQNALGPEDVHDAVLLA